MKMSKPFSLMQGVLLASVAMPAVSAFALDQPDAGRTLQQMQPWTVPQPPQKTVSPLEADSLDKPSAAPSGQPEMRFLVKSMTVKGSTAFPARELESLLTAMVGSERTLSELNEAARQITRYYRHHGYSVARAYLPAQTVQNGEVVIQVLEGKLNRIVLNNKSKVSDEYLKSLIEGRITPGQLMDTSRVNRALLLANTLPGVGRIQGALRAGEEVGTTNLIVSVPEGRSRSGDIMLDNTGNRFTGQYRLSGHMQFNNPLQAGDQLDLRATVSDESLAYGLVSWDMPVGVNGWRAGVETGYSRYVLGDQFASLDLHGDALTIGLKASYPLVLDVKRKILFEAALQQSNLSDITAFTVDKKVSSAVLTLSGNAVRGEGAGAWRMEGTFGSLSIDPASERAKDAAGAKSNGSFTKVTLSGSYLYSLSEKSGLYGSLSAQFAGKNLDSSEKFLLGGVGGVRAYPSGEGLGDEGWLATAEWRYRLLPTLQGVLFYDTGGVDVNHTPFAAGKNHRTLSGQGLGLNASPVPGVGLKLNVAWRGSEVPVSDGKDLKPRIWLQGSYQF